MGSERMLWNLNELVVTRTPLRISFFGGGTDLPEYSRRFGGLVVGTAISKYVYVAVRRRSDKLITLESPFGSETCYTPHEIKHELVRAVLTNMAGAEGNSIWISSDVPAQGCGLGTSSALVVGLVTALLHTRRLPNKPKFQLASLASGIESQLGNVGVQDTYLCCYGRQRFLHFREDGEILTFPLELDGLDKNLMLWSTGLERSSRKVQSAKKSVEALHEIKKLAEEFLEENDADKVRWFDGYLRQAWEIKKRVSRSVTNSEIDGIYDAAIDAGAKAGKLLGAGGGGHFVFYVLPESKMSVREKLTGLGLNEIPFSFDKLGCRTHEVGFEDGPAIHSKKG